MEKETFKPMSHEKQRDVHDKIMELLAEERCTVRDANAIITQVQGTIRGTAVVRFVGSLPYEF